MNGKELAAALGLSEAMVSKLRQRGMPTSSVEAAEKWRKRHLEAARTKGMRMGTAAPPPAAAPPGGTDDADDVDDNAGAYQADRARNEHFKAERSEIELRQLRGELVPLREVEQFQFTAARITRDRLQQVAPRIAADLQALAVSLVPEAQREAFAAALPVHELEQRLDAALRDALNDAAKAIEDAGRDDDNDGQG